VCFQGCNDPLLRLHDLRFVQEGLKDGGCVARFAPPELLKVTMLLPLSLSIVCKQLQHLSLSLLMTACNCILTICLFRNGSKVWKLAVACWTGAISPVVSSNSLRCFA
jgi:hypothetical protein